MAVGLLGGAPAPASGQARAGDGPRFTLRRLDGESGLRHDRFNIFLGGDRRGFRWIGSEGGAYRYDGQTLARFAVSGGETPYPEVLSDFFEDRDGRVWHSVAEGLVAYDPDAGEQRLWPVARDTAAMLDWELLAYDPAAHRLWVSNARVMVGVSAADGREVTPRVPTRGARYCDAGATAGGRLVLGLPWVIAPGLERITITAAGAVSVVASADSVIQGLTFNAGTRDRAGRTWLASDRGLVAYDARGDRHLATVRAPGEGPAIVFAVEPYGDYLLVATDSRGVWLFDPTAQRFLRKLDARSESGQTLTDRPRDLHAGADGVVLVSRGEGGVDVLVPQAAALRLIYRDDGTPLVATELMRGDAGEMFAATADGRVARVSASGRVSEGGPLPGEVLDTDHRQFARTRGGTVWHARRDRLYRRSPGAEAWLPAGGAGAATVAIHADGPDVLLETRAGLRRVSADGQVAGAVPVPRPAAYLGMFGLGEGRFLLSTATQWLYTVRLDGGRLVEADSLRKSGELLGAFLAAGADVDTLVVCGFDRSVRYLRPRSGGWTALDTLVEGADVVAIARDAAGRQWLSAHEGLLHAARGAWQYLRVDHGLPRGPAVPHGLQVATDGAVWGATRGGVYRYALGDASGGGLKASPATYLREVWVDGRPVGARAFATTRDGPPVLSLAAGHDQLQLSVGTVGLYDIEPPEFAYRIDGPGGAWRTLGTGGLLTLEGLAAGGHTLELTATDASGAQVRPLRLAIEKRVPFWQTAWFAVVVLLATGGLVAGVSFGVYRRRLAEERRRHARELLVARERERISRELHDDLGGDLSSILFLTDDDQPLIAADRAQIASLSRDALRNMRDIIWALHEGPGSLGELLGKLANLARERGATQGLAVEVEVAPAVSAVPLELPAPVRRHLYLFVKEALTNVLKHAHATRIRLAIEPGPGGTLRLEVADDGVGLPHDRPAAGHGFANLAERAAALAGHCETGAAPGGGTGVRLTIPWPPAGATVTKVTT